jgi:hypothetical protein
MYFNRIACKVIFMPAFYFYIGNISRNQIFNKNYKTIGFGYCLTFSCNAGNLELFQYRVFSFLFQDNMLLLTDIKLLNILFFNNEKKYYTFYKISTFIKSFKYVNVI